MTNTETIPTALEREQAITRTLTAAAERRAARSLIRRMVASGDYEASTDTWDRAR